MAIEIFLRKLYDSFVPADKAQLEVMEQLSPNGEYKAVLTKPRNYGFHRKAFALAKAGFDAWEPPEERCYNGKPIEKNFKSFREELTIRAGYYDVVWTLAGKMRTVPHSWSWSNADQTKFEEMYNAMFNVLLQEVLTNYTKDDLEELVEELLKFG